MKKSRSSALIAAKGVLIAIGLYVAAQLLLALLSVKGILPVGKLFLCQTISCAAATFSGGVFTARKLTLGSLPASMLSTGVFMFLQIAVGLSISDEIAWAGEGGVLLLCALGGGVLAGLFASRTVRRKKKRGKREK